MSKLLTWAARALPLLLDKRRLISGLFFFCKGIQTPLTETSLEDCSPANDPKRETHQIRVSR